MKRFPTSTGGDPSAVSMFSVTKTSLGHDNSTIA